VVPSGGKTYCYRAPEILLHDPEFTCKADWWSAGCVVYEMVTKLYGGKSKYLFDIDSTALLQSEVDDSTEEDSKGDEDDEDDAEDDEDDDEDDSSNDSDDDVDWQEQNRIHLFLCQEIVGPFPKQWVNENPGVFDCRGVVKGVLNGVPDCVGVDKYLDLDTNGNTACMGEWLPVFDTVFRYNPANRQLPCPHSEENDDP